MRRMFVAIGLIGGFAAHALAQQTPVLTDQAKWIGGGRSVASGEIIWDQSKESPSMSSQGFAAQDFEAANDPFDIMPVADISLTQDWLLGTVTALAFNHTTTPSNPAFSTDVVAQVWNGQPWAGGTVILSSTPGLGEDNTPNMPGITGPIKTDFSGQRLAAGNYYFSMQVVRPFSGGGGQIFILGRVPSIGANDMHYNPRRGFCGTNPPLCNCPTTPTCTLNDPARGPIDYNFVLTGKPDSGGCEPCDTNCDGTVDAFDIEPFIGILTGSIPNPCSACAGDADGSGTVDAFDIEPFITCLTGP